MRFTDIFIRRPVLAVSISLLIIILGLQAISKLAVREYPKMTTTVITVTTAYPGANANLIQAFVTSKIEEVVAQADNVDYMSSSSSPKYVNCHRKNEIKYGSECGLGRCFS